MKLLELLILVTFLYVRLILSNCQRELEVYDYTPTKQGAQSITCRVPKYNGQTLLTDRRGQPSCFSDWTEKQKLGKGR